MAEKLQNIWVSATELERYNQFQRSKGPVSMTISVLLLLLALYGFKASTTDLYDSIAGTLSPQAQASVFTSDTCVPPRPNIFAYSPPRPSHDLIVKATQILDKWLSKRVSQDDLDSLAVSVITPAGPIFEAGYGVLRANESCTEGHLPVDSNSIYRIASVSKMFTTLETLILRQRGALNWDDPVEKYLPDFAPPAYGWSNYLNGVTKSENSEPITLRQLSSHLAGLGRDLPPVEVEDWPSTGLPEFDILKPKKPLLPDGIPEKTYKSIMKAISEYPSANVPYNYPIYSNTGFDVLGLANVAANIKASSDPDSEPQNHKDLLKRDIFDPLGMNGSFYRVPVDISRRAHIAVPANDSEMADEWFGDADDPSGGQYSSLRDLGKLMQTLLSPVAKGGVLPADVVREWLRPLFVWGSSTQQVGVPWEIMDLEKDVRGYTKGGALPGYHSEFALVPDYSYGIVVLMTGQHGDTRTLLLEVAKHFHRAINELYQIELERRYVGTWINGEDVAEISLDKGQNALYVKKLVAGGVDILKLMRGEAQVQTNWPWDSPPTGLWSTGRVGEFRVALGRPALNDKPGIGCFPYWITIDPGLFSRGAPIDLLYWERGVLVYPSAGITFERK